MSLNYLENGLMNYAQDARKLEITPVHFFNPREKGKQYNISLKTVEYLRSPSGATEVEKTV